MAMRMPAVTAVRKPAQDAAGAAEQWGQLAAAFEEMYQRSHSAFSFQHLYNLAYQLVQHNHGEFVYQRLQQTITARVMDQRSKVLAASAETVLSSVIEQWGLHCVTTARTGDILMTLERMWCSRHKRPSINALGTRIFGECVVRAEPINHRLQAAFLAALDKDRRGESGVSAMLLRAVAQMCVEIDRRDVFEQLLEAPLLAATRAFYHSEATERLPAMSAPAYVSHFFERWEQEHTRIRDGVDESTVPKVAHIVAGEFIGNNIQALITKPGSGVVDLLRAARIADVGRLYRACVTWGNTTELVAAAAAFFLAEGQELLAQTEAATNPVTCVERLIGLSDQMNKVLRGAMHDAQGRVDRYAEAAFARKLEDVVNAHPSAAEFLSRYIDHKLRGNCDDEEMDTASDKVMKLFVKLRDKDLFEAAYKKDLARRLLAGRTNVREEHEHIFIQHLKRECGAGVASSLEGMFADCRVSDELMETFARRQEETGESLPIQLHVMVLTSGFWPEAVHLPLAVPTHIEHCAQVFRRFYLARQKNRRLVFVQSQGSVDVRLNHAGKRVDVTMPMVCVAVLFLFQGREELSVKRIADTLGVSPTDAARAVASLAKASASSTGVLAVARAGGGPSTAIAMSSTVTFNDAFQSRHAKLRIQLSAVKEKNADADTAKAAGARDGRHDEDRKFKIDAAIVRIMKSRKTLEHKVLVQEVVTMLKNLFVPSMANLVANFVFGT